MFFQRLVACLLITATTNVWPAEPTSSPAIEEVVVTASRIERPDFSYSNPVFSVDRTKIRASGEKNMTDLLKQIPALVSSWPQEGLTGSNGFIGANGLTALDLRSLGTSRTLVLINGRRSVGAPFPGGSLVDVDSIPMHLIERVEVMTGGASALYGADGVSGVVNFVMKDRYEGFEVFAQTGASSKHDAQSTNTSMTYGTAVAGGRGHLSLALDYAEDNRITPRRRGFSSGPDYAVFVDNPNNLNNDPNLPSELPMGDIRFYDFSPAGAVDINLDAVPEFDGDGTPWDAGQVPFVGPFYSQGGDGSPLVGFISDLLPDEERYSFNAMFDFEVSESLTFFSELSYVQADSYSVGEPSFDYILGFFPGSPYAPANIEAAAAGTPLLVTRDHFDFGKRSDETERETLRTVVGFEGAFTPNLEFEVSYTYGETDVESRAFNNRYNDRFAAALDAVVDPASGDIVCASELDPSAEPFNLAFQEWNDYDPQPGTWAGSFTPGAGNCVPINIFGNGSPSPEALAWIHTDSLARANMKQQVAQAYLRGNSSNWLELPAGPVGFVLGTEWRKETISADPADEDRLGYTFGNKFDGERGNQTVKEVFAEIDVPLLAQTRFAENLALDAAIRFSDYSTIGDTTTWKVGLVWQPWESLTLRSTVAEATRAPNMGELFAPLGQTFEFISDPCDVNNLDNGTAFRAANCTAVLSAFGVDPATFTDPNSFSLPGLNGGNRNLTEETADTTTFGIIFTPTFIESLTISIDWYDIELEDAIEYASPQDAADLCVDSASINNKFCDLITRDPDTGAVDNFVSIPNNVASFDTRGIDFTASYIVDPARWGGTERWGTVALTLNGNKLQELNKVNLPGAASVSEVGQFYRPEWQANFDAQWQGAKTSVTWRVHYFDETERYSETITDNNPNITSSKYLQYDRKLTQDLYGSYQFNEQLNLFAGVNNLTDEEPDIGEVFYPVSPLGRYIYAGLNFKL